MYCKNCGSEINEDAIICVHCGVSTGKSEANYSMAKSNETNTLALIGFILSFFVSIAGLVCSAIAYRRCKENPNLEGKNFAMAGIIISSIELGSGVLALVIYVISVLIMLGIFGTAMGGAWM